MEQSFLGKDQIKMIEGVIEVSNLSGQRYHDTEIKHDPSEDEMSIDQMLKIIIDSGHSRFPVIEDNKDEVIGILLAKDLLRFTRANK